MRSGKQAGLAGLHAAAPFFVELPARNGGLRRLSRVVLCCAVLLACSCAQASSFGLRLVLMM
jgi:hypothetical protein